MTMSSIPTTAHEPTPVDVQSVAFLQQMAQLVPGIIYVFNCQTMSNEYSNRSIAELLGYSCDEIQQMGENLFATIIHPDELARVGAHLQRLHDLPPGAQAVLEYRAVKRDGSEVWLRSVETVFDHDSEENVLRLVGIATDITAEKNAELRLRKLNSELEARVLERTMELEKLNNELEQRVTARTAELTYANKELEQLSYIATHDLKVPINNMTSLTHMLEEANEILPPEHVETLGWMKSVCNQAAEKLEALVCVAQANAIPNGPFEPVNLETIFERVMASQHHHVKEADALVSTAFGKSDVWFLPQEMEDIFQAILSNAIKYRAADRRLRVTISSTQSASGTTIRIADNGSGLNVTRDYDKVFGLFQRAHVTPEGAGVSLYAIRRIMEQIGGTVDVESEEGLGTTFALHFPEPQREKVAY